MTEFWIIAAMAALLAVFYDFLYRVLKLYYENEINRCFIFEQHYEEPRVVTPIENVDNKIKQQALLPPERNNKDTYEGEPASSFLIGEDFWYFK